MNNINNKDKERNHNVIKKELSEKTKECSGHLSLRIPKCLHRELIEKAKKEGTSLNQYAVYKLSKK